MARNLFSQLVHGLEILNEPSLFTRTTTTVARRKIDLGNPNIAATSAWTVILPYKLGVIRSWQRDFFLSRSFLCLLVIESKLLNSTISRT